MVIIVKLAFGNRSKQALSDVIFNKNVLLELHGKNKYRKTLATIYTDVPSSCQEPVPNDMCMECTVRADINFKMIEIGMAWYWPFTKNNEKYMQAGEQARKSKTGLWADKNPIAPWDFRRK
ncbi:hypothetical protein DM558_01135 [Entomomonas moraniae]|uniref:TNase-like domain-containing protein n=1 Tax=Entomomonas moraniae TaxID=2213226 RepID=A0A3S9XAJ3_9GAMM|nr:thermonuclease family protein [Entomomonas moraniae]AZS49463.1 hypothetical protein DM558_01135 [Entomomonas moraniae]